MKARYLVFRVYYALKTKLGILKKQFPTNPKFYYFLSLEDWRELEIPFFFSSAESLKDRCQFNLDNNDIDSLKEKVEKIKNGVFTYFSSTEYNIGDSYDWVTNPDTGYRYDINKHWSEIEDFNPKNGDIKYVWEKSRFTFLYDLIRFDYYSGKTQAEFVFNQIVSFIDANPINHGPNYKCSQEISLRIFNWTFALFYYKHSVYLTNETFKKIINAIYWQLDHVYKNINFSRISVRNNHAITETSALYLSGLLFPFFNKKKWHYKGKKWLVQEINYQIYPDGSYLQFSHNYHRVVVQTLTWVLQLSELNGIKLNAIKDNRLIRTVEFLFNHQNAETGWLPNYGNNDGALFFPLNSLHYRDYRPQLSALGKLLKLKLYEENFEDEFWLGIKESKQLNTIKKNLVLNYRYGGFYGFNDLDSLTAIRCGTYKDRPSQADALHLDIWYKGKNVLFDPGTFKYNTDSTILDFYNGTKGHNTISVNDQSQMLKGSRFIWYYWTKVVHADVSENEDSYIFEGSISGFKNIGKDIIHKRKVVKAKNKPIWIIEDWVLGKNVNSIKSHWNILPEISSKINITTYSAEGESLIPNKYLAWYSELYGEKQEFEQLVYKSENNYIKTIIQVKE